MKNNEYNSSYKYDFYQQMNISLVPDEILR